MLLDPRLAEARYALALSLRQAGQRDEAIQAFEQAVEAAPALSAAREQLAALYAEAGRASEGLAQLEALAALEPDRPERQVAVALAQARVGRTDLAVGLLGRAAERYGSKVSPTNSARKKTGLLSEIIQERCRESVVNEVELRSGSRRKARN